MLSPPTCVSFRYGHPSTQCGAFLGSMESAICVRVTGTLLTLITLRPRMSRLCQKTPTTSAYRLELPSIRQLTYPSPSPLIALCPWWFRNINLIPITYAFRPRLRVRLTLSGISLLEETLGLRRPGFSPGLSLLMSASSLAVPPRYLSVSLHWWLQRSSTAPYKYEAHSFGNILKPRWIFGAGSLDQ